MMSVGKPHLAILPIPLLHRRRGFPNVFKITTQSCEGHRLSTVLKLAKAGVTLDDSNIARRLTDGLENGMAIDLEQLAQA